MVARPKLYCPDDWGYAQPFKSIFEFVHQPEHSDVILFTGGTDINPSRYGELRGSWTDSPDLERDDYETELFSFALDSGKPVLGICRGAQLICIRAGGRLIQDVTGHNTGWFGYHDIISNEGKRFTVNSLHHQMMDPLKANVEELGWCPQPRSLRYLNGRDEEVKLDKELEVAYFPDVRGLAIQCHPECGMDPAGETMKWFHELIRTKLLK